MPSHWVKNMTFSFFSKIGYKFSIIASILADLTYFVLISTENLLSLGTVMKSPFPKNLLHKGHVLVAS